MYAWVVAAASAVATIVVAAVNAYHAYMGHYVGGVTADASMPYKGTLMKWGAIIAMMISGLVALQVSMVELGYPLW